MNECNDDLGRLARSLRRREQRRREDNVNDRVAWMLVCFSTEMDGKGTLYSRPRWLRFDVNNQDIASTDIEEGLLFRVQRNATITAHNLNKSKSHQPHGPWFVQAVRYRPRTPIGRTARVPE